MYEVDESEWERKCRAVNWRGPLPKTITDSLIERINNVRLSERIELPDRVVDGLYLRAGAARKVYGGTRTWMLRCKTKAGERVNYKIGDARVMTLTEARARARKAQVSVDDGRNPQAVARQEERQTVEHFLETTYAPRVLRNYKDGVRIKQNILATWESLLKLPLDTLTRDRIDEVLAGKKEDGSRGGTLLRVWGQFRHLLRDAGERELIPADQVVKLLRRPNALTGAKDGEHVRWLGQLDPDEPRKLSAALAAFETSSLGGGEFLRCAVRLSLATGMRAGEIVGLTEARVDLRQGTIFLKGEETKGNRDRMVHLSPAAVAALTRWNEVRKTLKVQDVSGRLFPGPALPWKLRLKNGGRDFRIMRRNSGIEGRCACCNRLLHMHDMRHDYAVRFLRNGGSMEQLQKALGHASIVTTQKHYGHIVETDVRRVVLAMPDVLAI